MLAVYATSWDAIASTTRSYAQTLFRVGTAPLFARMRAQLGELNKSFEHGQAGAEALARRVGDRLAGAFDRAVGVARRLRDTLRGVRDSAAGRSARSFLASPGGRSAALTGALGAAGLAMGVPGLGVVVSAFGHLARDTQVVGQVLRFLGQVAAPLASILDGVGGLLARFVAGALPGIMTGFQALLGPVQQLVTALAPHVGPLGSAFGQLIAQLGRLAGELVTTLIPYIPQLVGLLQQFIEALTTVVGWVRRVLPQQTESHYDPTTGTVRGTMTRYGAPGEPLMQFEASWAPAARAEAQRIQAAGEEALKERRAATPLAGLVPAPRVTTTAAQAGGSGQPIAVHAPVTVHAEGATDPGAVGDAVAAGMRRGTRDGLADVGLQRGAT
jgi:hypothetical protein